MTALELAVKELTTTYGDLDLIARSLQVDAAEVDAALAAAESDSAQGVALRLLAKYNPFVPVVKVSKKSL
jgi:hypothetical protein